jgi:hypothetical protein
MKKTTQHGNELGKKNITPVDGMGVPGQLGDTWLICVRPHMWKNACKFICVAEIA